MISPFPRHQNFKKIRKDFSFLWKWHKNKIELCVHKVCPCFFTTWVVINVLEHRIFHMKNISFHSDGWCICAYGLPVFTLLLADVQWPPRERLAHDSRRPWQFRRRFFIFHYIAWLWRFFPSFFTTRRRWKFVFVCQIKVGVRMTPAHTPPSMTQRWKPLQTKEKTNLDNPQSQVYPPDRIDVFYKKK